MEQYIFKKKNDGINIINLKKTWGFSTAAMARAASRIFSQVFFRLMMLIPSFFFLKMYCSMAVSELEDPRWVVAANILVMSSSVQARAECPPDIFNHDFFFELRKNRVFNATWRNGEAEERPGLPNIDSAHAAQREQKTGSSPGV